MEGVEIKAREHAARHRTFEVDRYLECVRSQGDRYASWAALQSTREVTKSLRRRMNKVATKESS